MNHISKTTQKNYLENNVNVPKNLEAESNLIGCLLTDPTGKTLIKVKELISADDFYLLANKIIFDAIDKTFCANNVVDSIIVHEYIKVEGNLDEIDIGDLLSCSDETQTTLQATYYAKIIKEKALLRNTIRACRESVEKAENEQESAEIIASLSTFITDNQPEVGVQKINETSTKLLEEFELMREGELEVDVIRTHIHHLDNKLGNGGIGPAEVCVVAAPTSCGKSALALNIALRTALEDTKPCLIFSLEMPAKQIIKRFVQALSGANLRQIQDRVISDEKMQKVRESFKIVDELPIYTEHSVKSIQDLILKTKTMVDRHGIKLVIIDYLQLIPWNNKMSKHDGIADVSHKIKQLALETNVSVLLLCQVNREGAKRETGLGLYDLKDSGDIENDADIAVLMYPKGGDIESCKMLDKHGPYTKLEYIVAKNREGERGVRDQFIFRHLSGRFY